MRFCVVLLNPDEAVAFVSWPFLFDCWKQVLQQILFVYIAVNSGQVSNTYSTLLTVTARTLGNVLHCECPNAEFSIPARVAVWIVSTYNISQVIHNVKK